MFAPCGSGGQETKPKKTSDVGPDRAYGRAFGREQHSNKEKARAWTSLTAAVDPDLRDALRLTGKCPLCTHDIDDFVLLTPSWVDGLNEATTLTTVARCNCDTSHEGRPEDQVGCGALAVLTVSLTPRNAPKGEKRPPEPLAKVESAKQATARDRTWDDDAAAWERAMNERLSGTAEKWGQTIAALFGLFGLALVFESDRVQSVVSSAATWPFWVLLGLLIVIGAACLYYWDRRRERDAGEPRDGALVAVSIATFAAAIGLALWAGLNRKAPLSAGVSFGILAGAAALMALTATAFAGLAAQGSPKWVSYLTGNRMRALRHAAGDASVQNLRRARLATVLAVLGLGGALSVLWYAPIEQPGKQKVSISLARGDPVCGDLITRAGPGVSVDPPGAQTRENLQIANITRVLPVDSCSP